MLITARILLTLAALGFSAITIVADLNKTHASNPLWTPHARFHVVWQVLSYSGIGLIALYLIWAGGPMQTERLYLAAALAVAVYGGILRRRVQPAGLWRRPVRRQRLSVVSGADRPENLAVGCQCHDLHADLGDSLGRHCRRGRQLMRAERTKVRE